MTPDINTPFGRSRESKWLKVTDFDTLPAAVRIETVDQAQMPSGETKFIMTFFAVTKKLILKNAHIDELGALFGLDTSLAQTVGKQVGLYQTTVRFQNQLHKVLAFGPVPEIKKSRSTGKDDDDITL